MLKKALCGKVQISKGILIETNSKIFGKRKNNYFSMSLSTQLRLWNSHRQVKMPDKSVAYGLVYRLCLSNIWQNQGNHL